MKKNKINSYTIDLFLLIEDIVVICDKQSLIMLLASFLFAFFLQNVNFATAVHNGHYKSGEQIKVIVSNVDPFHNPTEKYDYYHLPWPCKVEKKEIDWNIGSIISGERDRTTKYKINFGIALPNPESLCGQKSLTAAQVDDFIHAIKNDYQYEMWVDDLPVWGRVGFYSTENPVEYYLITHRHFHLRYNRDQVITVNISTVLQQGHYVLLEKGKPLDVKS
ncbi:EMP/nonaspanin domain family protein [Reticulomyxa filosa]|uniref:Transmembrane 9 superfamily member n=1 Tax=Reticulomyxa filosa TaxID=46433 RepID=X6NE44_RETFI|nr:EMP/nonaspanin domain family protein [Reticulomyxa filosa]|eukprot:ETO24009.1 EMP/nonaspanin domain family protein [Reticulomyxa filosa]